MKNTVLFIDARRSFEEVDRAHREFRPDQTKFLANIVRLYRERDIEDVMGSDDLMMENFPDLTYQDVPGLCKIASIADIVAREYSLNPGRYVEVADREEDEFDFNERLTELNDTLEQLNSEARELEERIAHNVGELIK